MATPIRPIIRRSITMTHSRISTAAISGTSKFEGAAEKNNLEIVKNEAGHTVLSLPFFPGHLTISTG
jgi:hypothetical protein